MILHITNDYSGSTVYKNLVGEIDKKGLSQIVYTPIKEENKIGKNKIEFEVSDSEIIYSPILNRTTDRLFYKRKIRKIVKDIETKINLSKIGMIHAHTWYSDGGVAYLLAKKYNIPYIIAVRSTDLNVHYKYFIQHRGLGREILRGAKRVVFIGKYQKRFFSQRKLLDGIIRGKNIVVPNGVDLFWIKNANCFRPKAVEGVFKILYIGTFIKRKNLLQLQDAVIDLSIKRKIHCELHIVGGGKGGQGKKILEKINQFPKCFFYYGIIKDKNQLLKIFKESHVFAMPSTQETFGLVYVEALLQGLPILYTANEGIDGFYEEKIGEKIYIDTVEEIKQKLMTLIRNYDSYVIPTAKLIENHNWSEIAGLYEKLYTSQ